MNWLATSGLVVLLLAPLAHAQAPIPPPMVVDVDAYIKEQAVAFGVNTTLALYVAHHEGYDDLKARGDMDITCSSGVNKGKPVRAKGQWQITDCYYPDVSDECADSLECSTQIAMPLLKNRKTCITQFSTCRTYYEKDPR